MKPKPLEADAGEDESAPCSPGCKIPLGTVEQPTLEPEQEAEPKRNLDESERNLETPFDLEEFPFLEPREKDRKS